MGIFSRFTDIVNSNITALLDKAEDPQKMIRLMIQEMEETLVEIRSVSARAIAEKTHIARKAEHLNQRINDWQEKAELAIRKGNEELARAAIGEKQKVTAEFDVLAKEQSVIDETINRMRLEIKELEAKLNEARTRQKSLALRQEAATTTLDARRQLESGKIDKALARFEQYERRIDDIEAESESYQLTKTQSLEEQFNELKATDEIDSELAALKAKLNKKDETL